MDVRDAGLADLPAILGLLKEAKATVGFLPDEAVIERIHKGTLLVAVSAEKVAGYLLYDLPAYDVTIRQLAVGREVRRAGAAGALVRELVKRYESSRRGIGLTCRRDYEANDVWHRLEFLPQGERRGRGKQARVLTRWWRSFGHPDLFSLARESDDRPIAALDTNLVIRGAAGDTLVTERLLSDWLRAEVVLAVAGHTLVELNRHDDIATRRRERRYVDGFEKLMPPAQLVEGLHQTMVEKLGRTALPHVDDVKLACQAAAAGARWFVTGDGRFRRACGDALQAIAAIEVVSAAEMVLAADQLVKGELYDGEFLQGTDIEVRRVFAGEIDGLASTFLNQKAGETLKTWRSHLHDLAADVGATELYVFTAADGPLALAGLAKSEALEVPVCRVRRGAAEPTLARQLLGWLRNRCLELRALAVRIQDEGAGEWIHRGCLAEGYLPGHRPTAVPLVGRHTIQQVAETLASPPYRELVEREQAETLAGLPDSAEAAHSVEAAFHPAIIAGAGLRTIRVPIRPQYATELFDHSLSEGQLFFRDRSMALKREHVYFRAPTAATMLTPPARLLWQVTGSPRHGGRTLRGWSLLDDMAVGDVEKLIARFSHLGVLGADDIRRMAKAGRVMALRFSHTSVFPRPIGLAEYRDVMRELQPGTGLTHAGPQPIDEQVFVRLATITA